jgi:hypothetical protein
MLLRSALLRGAYLSCEGAASLQGCCLKLLLPEEAIWKIEIMVRGWINAKAVDIECKGHVTGVRL